MQIQRLAHESVWPARRSFHVLTYAEIGFAPLTMHLRGSGIATEVIENFAYEVNTRGEVGSLYPGYGLSAVPRYAIRDEQAETVLADHIQKFLEVNSRVMVATRVLLDFRTPGVEPFVWAAIERAIKPANGSLH